MARALPRFIRTMDMHKLMHKPPRAETSVVKDDEIDEIAGIGECSESH